MKLNHARLTYSKLATSETKPNSLLKAILLSTMLAEKWNFHAAYVPTYFVLWSRLAVSLSTDTG